MKHVSVKSLLSLVGAASLALSISTSASAVVNIAVWNDGQSNSGGNAIPARIAALGYNVTQVTNAQLEVAGFLNSFDAIAVSRSGASFGSFFSAGAAANVAAYVGAPGAGQGGVAIFTNDAADNLQGAGGGDPFDANLDSLFTNAVTFAAASHHGYIGEFNGAVMAMASNSAGAPALGLLQGNATGVHGFGPQFTYGVGPIGAGNPIDSGVTFPFTDTDNSTFLTAITGEDSGNVVDIYTNPTLNSAPAVLANSFVITGGNPGGGAVPEPSTYGLFGAAALLGLVAYRRRSAK